MTCAKLRDLLGRSQSLRSLAPTLVLDPCRYGLASQFRQPLPAMRLQARVPARERRCLGLSNTVESICLSSVYPSRSWYELVTQRLVKRYGRSRASHHCDLARKPSAEASNIRCERTAGFTACPPSTDDWASTHSSLYSNKGVAHRFEYRQVSIVATNRV